MVNGMIKWNVLIKGICMECVHVNKWDVYKECVRVNKWNVYMEWNVYM